MPENTFNHPVEIPPILYDSEVEKITLDTFLNYEAAAKARDRLSGDLQQEYFERDRELGSAVALGMTVAKAVGPEQLAISLRGVTGICDSNLRHTLDQYADPHRHGMPGQAGRLKIWRAALPALVAYKGLSTYPFTHEKAREERRRLAALTFVGATAALPSALDAYQEHFANTGKHDLSSTVQELTLLALMNCANDPDNMFLPALDIDHQQRHVTGVLVSNSNNGASLRYITLRHARGERRRHPYQAVLNTVDLDNSHRDHGKISYNWKTTNALIRDQARAEAAIKKGKPLDVPGWLRHKRDTFMHVAMRDAVVFDLA